MPGNNQFRGHTNFGNPFDRWQSSTSGGGGPAGVQNYPAPGEGAPREGGGFRLRNLHPGVLVGDYIRRAIGRARERERTRQSMTGAGGRPAAPPGGESEGPAAPPSGGLLSHEQYRQQTFGGLRGAGYRDTRGSATFDPRASGLSLMASQAQLQPVNNTAGTSDEGQTRFNPGAGMRGQLIDGRIEGVPMETNFLSRQPNRGVLPSTTNPNFRALIDAINARTAGQPQARSDGIPLMSPFGGPAGDPFTSPEFNPDPMPPEWQDDEYTDPFNWGPAGGL